ncbi:nucleotidyltransferase family protein [Thalassotalea nanhaiensis]|uniref:Nucleotidyltransferase family protein n=1 Tax=Thalassotalea nanhaiensis TaxID=3065648 RepID=A0ABY9TLD1_9GAMM|nr:nucleotidyltransferase family protein [Colwelliaceae bacterium SQ345]
MREVTQQSTSPNITEQTFIDMGMWLTHPNEHTAQQLETLLDEDARLPLITLVNTYWLGGALHNSLNASKVWHGLDPELQGYLAELGSFYHQRNEGIKHEAIFACQQLSEENIPVVILKGGASLFNGVFKTIGDRFMTDIDLLVPEHFHERANQVLMTYGYSPHVEGHEHTYDEHHHAPPLFRDGGYCSVELHRWALKRSESDVLSTDEIWQEASALVLTDTLTALHMSPSQQVVLSIAHSELSHKGYETEHIDWRQLLNVYAIATHYQEQIHWDDVFAHFKRCRKVGSLSATLCAAYKYFELTTPITNSDDKQAMRHVETCIKHYVDRQKPGRPFSYLQGVLNEYRKENMLMSYGGQGTFPVLSARMKLLKRHLLTAVNPKSLIRFIKKVFSS